MRFFTCTPVAFGGGADFFTRDSGLLCRGFQALGIDSRAVMPGARKPEECADLLRTDYKNLESAEWWRAQDLDGVVLYAWGRPRFRKVAAAIHNAGIFLVLNQDNGGLVSPLAGLRDWLAEQWIHGGQGRGFGPGKISPRLGIAQKRFRDGGQRGVLQVVQVFQLVVLGVQQVVQVFQLVVQVGQQVVEDDLQQNLFVMGKPLNHL